MSWNYHQTVEIINSGQMDKELNKMKQGKDQEKHKCIRLLLKDTLQTSCSESIPLDERNTPIRLNGNHSSDYLTNFFLALPGPRERLFDVYTKIGLLTQYMVIRDITFTAASAGVLQSISGNALWAYMQLYHTQQILNLHESGIIPIPL